MYNPKIWNGNQFGCWTCSTKWCGEARNAVCVSCSLIDSEGGYVRTVVAVLKYISCLRLQGCLG